MGCAEIVRGLRCYLNVSGLQQIINSSIIPEPLHTPLHKAVIFLIINYHSLLFQVREEIEKFGIKVYQFPECDSDEDDDFKQQDKELKVNRTRSLALYFSFCFLYIKKIFEMMHNMILYYILLLYYNIRNILHSDLKCHLPQCTGAVFTYLNILILYLYRNVFLWFSLTGECAFCCNWKQYSGRG